MIDSLRSPISAMEGDSFPTRVARHIRREAPLVIIDLTTLSGAYLAMLVLRFDGAVPDAYWTRFWAFLPVIALVHVLMNYFFGLYGQMWRYASVQEARRVIIAGAAGGALVVVASLWLDREGVVLPRSVAVLGAILALIGFGATRFQSRLFALRRRSVATERSKVLVAGAGDAGAMVIRDLLRNPAFGLDPVAIVDDDPRKLGLRLHGLTVVGNLATIPDLATKLSVDHVLLAIPSATSVLVRQVAAQCEAAEVVMRVLPSIHETVTGRITARDIRDLSIEDLLGRQQVETDLKAVGENLRGRRVLITGAGGSIGSEISRQVANFEPSELILLDHDETHLYEILNELEDPSTSQVLADIRDGADVLAIFTRHRPEIVFHAAAHKHVPVLETYPEEALRTNVLGTANLVDAAVATGVEQFVTISTDKAIRPSSVMGATKWFAEQIAWSAQGNGCRFSAVRFGNVLGSRGSVVPRFLSQISAGGPVTVTDAAMERYFMSVREAVQLVLQGAALSRGGEVFTLEMGQPVNVLQLAKQLIRLSGRVPDKDIEVRIVGRRPGEKLTEDLTDPLEEIAPSGHNAIRATKPVVSDRAALRRAVRALEFLARERKPEELAASLKLLAGHKLESAHGELAVSS